MDMLRFSLDSEKTVNGIAYLAAKCTGATKMKLCKLLYYADKEHLLQYGRPITGDTYMRMEYGPTPSTALNLMRGLGPTKLRAAFQSKVQVHGNEVQTLSSADLKVFSKSDIKVLDEICERYGKHTAAQLSKLSHKEASWIKTEENRPIDFELMFAGRPDAEVTLQLLKEEQQDSRAESKSKHVEASA